MTAKKKAPSGLKADLQFFDYLQDEYCYVEDEEKVCRIRDGKLTSPSAFRVMFNSVKVVWEDDAEPVGAGSAWLANPERNTANSLSCNPMQDQVFRDENDFVHLNLWRQPGVTPIYDPQLLADIERLAEHLCRDEGDEALRYLWRHTLAPLRFKAVKMLWAINLVGIMKGTGKSLFGKGVRQAHGRGGKRFKKDIGEAKFNKPILGCTYALCDEWINGKPEKVRKRYEWAKDLISETDVMIEGKGADQTQDWNMATFMFNGNEIDAADIEEFDRRHFLINVPEEPLLNSKGKKDKALYRRVDEAIRNGRLGGVLMWKALSEDAFPLTPERKFLEDKMLENELAQTNPDIKAEMQAERLRGRVCDLPDEQEWTPEDWMQAPGSPEPLLWNLNPGDDPPPTLSKLKAQDDNRWSLDSFILHMLEDPVGNLGPLYPELQRRDMSNYWGYAGEWAAIYNHLHPDLTKPVTTLRMGRNMAKFMVSTQPDKREPRLYLLIPPGKDLLSDNLTEAQKKDLIECRRQCSPLKGQQPPDSESLNKPFIETCKDLEGSDNPLPSKHDILRWAGKPEKLEWN